MSSQMTVIIAGIVLVVAIVVALVIMRRGDSRFTYDTQHGTAPRATEGEGNTAATAFKGRFSILTTGVGAMFAALAVKLWGMQMVSSDYYEKQANSNQTRTVTTPAVRGRILDRNGEIIVDNKIIYDLEVVPIDVQPFDTLAFCEIFDLDPEFVRERFDYYKKYRSRIDQR